MKLKGIFLKRFFHLTGNDVNKTRQAAADFVYWKRYFSTKPLCCETCIQTWVAKVDPFKKSSWNFQQLFVLVAFYEGRLSLELFLTDFLFTFAPSDWPMKVYWKCYLSTKPLCIRTCIPTWKNFGGFRLWAKSKHWQKDLVPFLWQKWV